MSVGKIRIIPATILQTRGPECARVEYWRTAAGEPRVMLSFGRADYILATDEARRIAGALLSASLDADPRVTEPTMLPIAKAVQP